MAKKEELLPAITSTFAEIGYRRATTAILAQRCQVQETILYRIWADKKAMFVDAIDYVAERTLNTYRDVLAASAGDAKAPAEALLAYESRHIGEFGNYRIIFAALPETNEPDIRDALQRMYRQLHAFIVETVARSAPGIDAVKSAWGLIGLGTMMTISDGLGLMNRREREDVFRHVGSLMLGATESEH
jgi:AcrR family transcriptional regulator